MVDVQRQVSHIEVVPEPLYEVFPDLLQPPKAARRLRQVRIVPERAQREQEEHTRRARFTPAPMSQAPYFIHDGGHGEWGISMDE